MVREPAIKWRPILLKLVFAVLLLAFAGASIILADPPPTEEDQPYTSDPADLERLADDLFDAIFEEGDGTAVWEGWTEETQDAVVHWVEDSVSIEEGSDIDSGATADSADGIPRTATPTAGPQSLGCRRIECSTSTSPRPSGAGTGPR